MEVFTVANFPDIYPLFKELDKRIWLLLNQRPETVQKSKVLLLIQQSLKQKVIFMSRTNTKEKSTDTDKSEDYYYIPMDSQSFLEEVRIGLTEVSKLSEVPVNKLQYWIEQDYLESAEEQSKGTTDRFRYGYETVNKAILIRQGLERGYNLQEAVHKAEDFLEQVDANDYKFGEPQYKKVQELMLKKAEEIYEALKESATEKQEEDSTETAPTWINLK